MATDSLTIWCNADFVSAQRERWEAALPGHRWVEDAAGLAQADVALGQPDPEVCRRSERLRWLALNTAGYTNYDTPDFRETLRARGTIFTNMSSVFADSCAQHVLGMMLALNRRLPDCWADQQAERPGWAFHERRAASTLLSGQTVLILSFGAIARRLVELLQPFGVKIYALRRRAYSESGVHVIGAEQLTAVLPQVDHVVNILPHNEDTDRFVNARRLALLKRSARFYNIGRGGTVDQEALAEALRAGRLDAAYLDVTEPEPLPPEHVLWHAPRCYITPHTAGGFDRLAEAQGAQFLANFARWVAGEEDAMVDRIE